ncbi:MAG: GTPase Era [Bacteroidetes bacterium CG02_land_8_20_14_3_00_31_25]|nr:GTPase Era [Bacteroidota bacterium]PIV58298.1 MAG: GTPase Era [Bacteroidetes bacterium CG02_land_8_20_14_3_00_31_25]PIY05669.1 MAG: GTPase Era [Bacteroidetes bacterium CG_4_10_14_3_um_filter_31_20]
MHKAGFVNIIGKPNAGKSTLMNLIIGEKLSIVTPKAQTTRHRIISILNGDNYQIVFSDTPGIIEPSYKMQECMMTFVEEAYKDADILIFLADASEEPDIKNIPADLLSTKIPIILVLNKIDLSEQETVEKNLKKWQEIFPNAKQLAISALRNFNVNSLTSLIVELLPESPPYYDKETLTDRSQRFFISEIIREKTLLLYHKEIPYCVEIDVEEFKEDEKIIRISAIIYVVRSSQKMIIIGEGGRAIKRLGTDARKDIEEFLGKKVFLQLFVKVQKNWRDNTLLLKKFGYIK